MADPNFLRRLFLEHFVHQNEKYQAAHSWTQTLRRGRARLTMPRHFFLAHATPAGWHHVRYDIGRGAETAVDAKQVDRAVADGIRQFPWFTLLTGLLAVVGLVWLCRSSSLSAVVFKALFLAALGIAVHVLRTKRTKVFVGYALDHETRSRHQALGNAFQALHASHRVWLSGWQVHAGALSGPPSAGVDLSAVAVLRRAIPNVVTNVRVRGLTGRDNALYFLPDKVIVVERNQIRYIEYSGCTVTTGHVETPEPEDQACPDAVAVGKRRRHLTADNVPDLRFADNPEVAVLRLGRLALDVGDTRVDVLTSNPDIPERFKQHFFSTPFLTAAAPPPPDFAGAAVAFGQRMSERTRSVLRALKDNAPAKAWLALGALAVLLAVVGWGMSLLGAADRDVERANLLYDDGKRAEAVALYAKHPERFWRPGGDEVRNLRRVIEFELERGDAVEAKAWMEKALDRDVRLEFNSAAAAELYASLKAERERQRAKAEAEAAARKRQREAEEARQRKEREDEEEFQRLARAARDQREKEARERAKHDEARQRENEERQRVEAAEKQRAEEEAARKTAALARAEEKAAANLRYANKLLDEGLLEKGLERLRDIVKDYPGTPSAAEAKRLLTQLGKR